MTRATLVLAGVLARIAATSVVLGCGDGGGESPAGEADDTGAPPTTGAVATDTNDPSASGTAADSSTGETSTWTTVLETDESQGALFSVWGPDASRVYVVGGQQGPGLSQGTMLVREGGTYEPRALPTDTPKLHWIHGGPNVRVVVGERGGILRRDGDDDTTPWTLESCATVLPLWGAWAIADDDVWVVGGDGFDRPPVLCHFDGAAWTNVELPALDGDPKALFKVFGLAADDVWSVGDNGLVLHYDGSTWSQVPTDTPSDLISLWGTGPDDLLAVGGRSSGVLARWNGAAWSVADLVETPGLNGIWMDVDGRSHAVGLGGTAFDVDPGATTPMPRDVVPTNLTLHAVWSPGDGTFIAVGGSLEMPPPLVGIVVERL